MADDLSTEEKTAVAAAEAALGRLSERRGVEDWLVIGRALAIVRNAALRVSNSNRPLGRHYVAAYGRLLPADLRKNMSKNERNYAVNLYEKWPEIEQWYIGNTDDAAQRLQYPANILAAYTKHKRRVEHPNEPVARIQSKRTLDLSSTETMLLSWRTLEDLYGIGPIAHFAICGYELYGACRARDGLLEAERKINDFEPLTVVR